MYYALVNAGCQSLAHDMGIEFDSPIEHNSDARVATGIGDRIGVGRSIILRLLNSGYSTR